MPKLHWPLFAAIFACAVLSACAKLHEAQLQQMQHTIDTTKRAKAMMTPQLREQCIAAIKERQPTAQIDPALHFDSLASSGLAKERSILSLNDNPVSAYITKCSGRNIFGNEKTMGCGCLFEVTQDRLIFNRAVNPFRMQPVPVPPV